MSRIAKWKLEKTKVKVVFRLQFHATHIPQTGWDKLFVSFIPADSVKATAKTSKASVRNGTCKWADPIYETTRLIQDTKTKQYDEKRYKLVVAMGSSRSSFLGEANINLADYADASQPSAIALPLQGCNFGTVLHVRISYLLNLPLFSWKFEQQRELRETGLQPTNQNAHESAENLVASAEMGSDLIDKVNARVRFKSESRELPSLEEVAELTEEYADSATGVDVSSNTSGSLYAEKHDSSTHEIDSLKSTTSGDLGGLSHSQSSHPDKGDHSDHRLLAHGASDWVQGWSSDYSLDNDLAAAYEENSRLRGSLDVAESSILELKLEVSSLHNQANELGAKTQKFAQVLDAEIVSGEELANEVSVLKSECSKFKDDFEQLKHSRLDPHLTFGDVIATDQVHLFQALQMRWMQGLLVLEEKVREVQTKARHEYHERDFSFLHRDFELLEKVLQDLRQGTTQVLSSLNVKPAVAGVKEIGAMSVQESEQFLSGDGLHAINTDLYQYEDILHNLGRPAQVSCEPDYVDATIALEGKISELHKELEESKFERDSLTRKLDQMECYYEALIQELEESQKQMLGELQNLRTEHSTCLYTISSCKTQMEAMHQDMNTQFLRFAEDRRDLESLNKELEKRAIASETALKRARWNHSVAVGQLQKDLELLSFQVLSMFETNENLIRQAFAESSQDCFQEYLDENSEAVDSCLQKDFASLLQGQNATSVQMIQAEVNLSQKTEQALASDQILLGDLKRSLRLQEELYQKAEDELCEMHVVNLNLDVFSKVLQETLHESTNGIKLMKEKLDELAEQLAHSTVSNELLMLRLQASVDDVNTQRKKNADCITRYDELALQNQMLEEKLQGISNENYVLTQKVSDYERLIMESRSYESKYEVCIAEKTELLSLLKQETLEKCSLQNEISSLHEELKNLKADFDIQFSFKGNLEQTVSFLQDMLRDMMSTMVSYDEQINGPYLTSKPVQQEVDNKNFMIVFLHLEQLQKKAYEKIVQLIQEKKDVEEQRDIAQGSLSSTESEILFMKQKYESDVQDMMTKLDTSMDHLEKLQLEIENVANKLKLSSEAEERYAEKSKELSSKLAVFEVELQNVTSENRDLTQKILALENVNEELERTKLTVVDSARENQAMIISVHASNEESVKLANELTSTKESLRCARDELFSETSLRVELENKVADLFSQLNVKNDQVLSFDMHKTELVHLQQLVSDIEQEKSRVCRLLLHSEESGRKADADASSLRLPVTDLETHVAALHEYLLAADVELMFTRNQFQSRMQELVQQLESLDRCYRELHFKHLDVLNTVNDRIASKAQYVEENAGLLSNLNSLRSELEATVVEKKSLLDRSNIISAELEKHKNRAAVAESNNIQDKLRHELEVEHLKHMILNSEEVIDNLNSSREELEVTVVVLRNKLDEQRLQLLLLEEYGNELTMLRNQQKELTKRLSEQILKTEEFKNLSIHLKELKDKADAECLQAREKKEAEGTSVATQESLRMVFIREQCETKLQEMRSQLYVSQKHGEEMLLKLQDALDEVENRKKTEVSYVKRSEELSQKIQELESELQTVLADKREKVNIYDRMKAELECSLISLECCKEEKQKLEASLQECNEERYKMTVELSSMKERFESFASSTNTQVEGNSKTCVLESMSTEPVTEEVLCEEVKDASRASLQDGNMSKSVLQISRQAVVGQEDLLQNSAKHLALINERDKAHSLMSSMDHLHKELERMKNENLGSLLPQDQQHFQPVFQGLQRELLQLHKTNEQLGSIFPLFSEFSSCGNALERVLALEMELAEALQGKKKSNVHFQSSFLKQHSDEEAIFQSFKDINELIKDMLELKGRYVTVETELKEMHDRYSQLSLQFAEVEGERQKLVMTLKNARSPKKLAYLYRSASDSLGDHS
ncbi:EEIG1/EHBP1 N-terminal domain [Macleaya cordata]|uniref:EEIG1/EHBP1 N-terminal domain n=1 Tax=Macleaya cordata TaxID=56857 RepID=A0A200PYJ8_MACCD|nr:EEIG1/EHBP1 N-terminal domain [Macleaya cordata]